MAPSFDCAVSSLLCAEDTSSIFDDSEYGSVDEVLSSTWHHQSRRSYDHHRVVDFNQALQMQDDDFAVLMAKNNSQHLPDDEYLNRLRTGDLEIKARMEAVDWIGKVHAHFNFGPLSAYLSVNYLDRFLAAYQLPKGKAWTMQLLAVACLSIAAKMEKSQVLPSIDLQVGESKFVFEGKTIQRMELMVLSTLKWRMHTITPFSYLDYFLNKLNINKNLLTSSIARSSQLLLRIIRGIDFLEFKPSEVAAAVAFTVSVETLMNTEEATCVLIRHVQKERMLKCVEMIRNLRVTTGWIRSVPQSPSGVLDAICFSYRSDETTVIASSSSTPNSHDMKRRKLNRALEKVF